MKKLLFVLAFAFIGQQSFSQMYIVTLVKGNYSPSYGCDSLLLITVDPLGNETYDCFSTTVQNGALSQLNIAFNNIINQGYTMIPNAWAAGNGDEPKTHLYQHIVTGDIVLLPNANNLSVWIFAAPWSASGLEEVTTTLNSLSISPNPANEFVNISLGYDLKGESEIVFISEAGYVYHKESIGSISKNETYNIDISKIPAGKYLVTIKNGKTYTTPQKLIIL